MLEDSGNISKVSCCKEAPIILLQESPFEVLHLRIQQLGLPST